MKKKVNKPLIVVLSAIVAFSLIAGVIGTTYAMKETEYNWTAPLPNGNYGNRVIEYGNHLYSIEGEAGTESSPTQTGVVSDVEFYHNTYRLQIGGVRNVVSSDTDKATIKADPKTSMIEVKSASKPGIVTVTVASSRGVMATYEILNQNRMEYIYEYKLKKQYAEIKSNETYKMSSVLSYVSYIKDHPIAWSSYDENVATVTSDGDITGVSKGVTVIKGDFTDCYGQLQQITFVVGVDYKVGSSVSSSTDSSSTNVTGIPIEELSGRDFKANKVVFVHGSYAYRIIKEDDNGNFLIVTNSLKQGDALYYTKSSGYTEAIKYTGATTYSEIVEKTTYYVGTRDNLIAENAEKDNFYSYLKYQDTELFDAMCTVIVPEVDRGKVNVPEEDDYSFVSDSAEATKRAFALSDDESHLLTSATVSNYDSDFWFIRTKNVGSPQAIKIVYPSSIGMGANSSYDVFGIRPAMWIHVG